MYQHILLAADGSQNSLRAAKETIKLAAAFPQCTVEVVMVADYDKSRYDILHAVSSSELELKRRKILAPVEELLQTNNISYRVKILHGEPGPAIVDYANQEKVELLVIGSRGLNALQEMVLGSVSHKVVKRAQCPVMIVK
ncbi:universal stress protein [Paenibacillus lemnae]|uniref:Universal stress protein n=1 Tax=Paenibacillus lemnae TaxID=1330551 RepID=A0A848MCU6_PAELE|nr:universal stress protein [Paenibacillus lemnae]NMO97852.1 universal stress protein [Paenibacillus lemnae]